MRIYLSHSMADYGSNYQKEVFVIIKNIWGKHDYINPANVTKEEMQNFIDLQPLFKLKRNCRDININDMVYFLHLIKNSDMLIAIPNSKKNDKNEYCYTRGVKSEITFAKNNDIPVKYITNYLKVKTEAKV